MNERVERLLSAWRRSYETEFGEPLDEGLFVLRCKERLEQLRVKWIDLNIREFDLRDCTYAIGRLSDAEKGTSKGKAKKKRQSRPRGPKSGPGSGLQRQSRDGVKAG